MPIFESKTIINATLKAVFEFHANSNNILKIKDPSVETIIDEFSQPMQEGSIVALRVKKFGITQKWRVKIEKFEPYSNITDLALTSPFAYWRHEHLFKELEDTKVELTDKIEYKMPFGLLGRAVGSVLVNDLKKIFEYRQRATKEILEK